MIRLTLEHTDNLGPEADLGALLRKFDLRLRAAPVGDAHVLVDARVLVDYVAATEGGAWATLALTLAAPASLEAALAPLPGAFLDLADAHLAELYPRNSIVLVSRLALHPDAAEIERRHRRPPGPGF
jgi:hypothetical protein